jgi:SAM-dependent methyltransferase
MIDPSPPKMRHLSKMRQLSRSHRLAGFELPAGERPTEGVDSQALLLERARGHLAAGAHRSPLLSSIMYLRGQARQRLGLSRHASGATGARLAPEQHLEYARRCADDYLFYAGAGEGFLQEKRVLELGPGDNLGTALCLLAKGAARVVAVDAHDPPLHAGRNQALYRGLLESFPPAERARAERAVRDGGGGSVELDRERVLHLRRVKIEDAPRALGGERFDVVLSRAVLEHVADLPRAWDAMLELLAPGGEMWHKVDLRHHHFFGAIHPLHFLTCNERAWRWISSPDPTLNRSRVDVYRTFAERSFERVALLITHVLDGDEIVPHVERLQPGLHFSDRELALVRGIRPRLLPRFQTLDDEDLLVGGIFLLAREPRTGVRIAPRSESGVGA